MFKAYSDFWKKYVDFKGESSRSDFWYAYLINAFIFAMIFAIIGISSLTVPSSVAMSFDVNSIYETLIIFYAFSILIPTLSIMTRRLQDAGLHWAYMFLGLIPNIGVIVLLIVMTMPSSSSIRKNKN